MPDRICRDENNSLHSTTQSAIHFRDGYEIYFIHGRAIPESVFERCRKDQITKEDFIQEQNAEIKAAIYEILGQEKIIQLLGAEEISRGTFSHANGDIEEVILYKTKEKFEEADGNSLAWVKLICPSTGTNYLIDVEPHHSDAREAAISTSPLFRSIEEYSFTDRT